VRQLRLKAPGLYHHIYNPGNDRNPIFKGSRDFSKYLEYLKIYSEKYRIDIIAYALMEWHIHLFIHDQYCKISEFIESLHGRYAITYNKVHERTSHVFGNRFKNKIVDANSYGLWLSRYIHRQAVEAGLVSNPEDYEWTSYHTYIGYRKDTVIKKDIILAQFGNTKRECYEAYKKFVDGENEGPLDWRSADRKTHAVIGDNVFVEEVSVLLGLDSSEVLDVNDVLNQVRLCFDVSIGDLKKPPDAIHRRIRNCAIVALHREYDIGIRKIARTLEISPSFVHKVLKKGVK